MDFQDALEFFGTITPVIATMCGGILFIYRSIKGQVSLISEKIEILDARHLIDMKEIERLHREDMKSHREDMKGHREDMRLIDAKWERLFERLLIQDSARLGEVK